MTFPDKASALEMMFRELALLVSPPASSRRSVRGGVVPVPPDHGQPNPVPVLRGYAETRGAVPNRKGRVPLYDAHGALLGHGDLARWADLPVRAEGVKL